jgi:hypothetical protein
MYIDLFGYARNHSVTEMMRKLSLYSFDDLVHRSRESFYSRISSCDTDNVIAKCASALCP